MRRDALELWKEMHATITWSEPRGGISALVTSSFLASSIALKPCLMLVIRFNWAVVMPGFLAEFCNETEAGVADHSSSWQIIIPKICTLVRQECTYTYQNATEFEAFTPPPPFRNKTDTFDRTTCIRCRKYECLPVVLSHRYEHYSSAFNWLHEHTVIVIHYINGDSLLAVWMMLFHTVIYST